MISLTYYIAVFALLLIFRMSRSGEVLTTGEIFVTLVWFLLGFGLYQVLKGLSRGRK